jgi:hypothetical protein
MYSFSFILIAFWPLGIFAQSPTVIKVPKQVQADTPFQVTVQAKLENGNTTYCDTMRVFLETFSEERRHFFYDAERTFHLEHIKLLLITHSARVLGPRTVVMSSYCRFRRRFHFPQADPVHCQYSGRCGPVRSVLRHDGSAIQHRWLILW